MADKRYQVFISSTFTDLKDERAKLIQELMNANCIPAGMELFPATNEEQFEFIRTVIDDSDYVLLVLAGKYGSKATDGVSYTEKEYDYAVKHDKTVIALLHEDPSVFTDKTDVDKDAAEKLALFRDKVKTGRVVRKWKTEADIVGATISGVNHAIRTHEAVGWVRGDRAQTLETAQEVNSLRKTIDELRDKIANTQFMRLVPELAELDEEFDLDWYNLRGDTRGVVHNLTWAEVFIRVAFEMGLSEREDVVVTQFTEALGNRSPLAKLSAPTVQTIKATLMAHGFIVIAHASGYDWWQLTKAGSDALIQLTAARTRKVKPA